MSLHEVLSKRLKTWWLEQNTQLARFDLIKRPNKAHLCEGTKNVSYGEICNHCSCCRFTSLRFCSWAWSTRQSWGSGTRRCLNWSWITCSRTYGGRKQEVLPCLAASKTVFRGTAGVPWIAVCVSQSPSCNVKATLRCVGFTGTTAASDHVESVSSSIKDEALHDQFSFTGRTFRSESEGICK